MGFHTYDPDRAPNLEAESRYRFCSAEELRALFDLGGVVADLGSGTGFYTDDVAPHVETCYAVDVQREMHEFYREKGVPQNVEPVEAAVDDLPFPDDHLDGAFSTMTYHEFGPERPADGRHERTEAASGEGALAELHRVLNPDARVGIVDWSANGEGAEGPPLDERFALDDCTEAFAAAGFTVEFASERQETFACSLRLAP
ncbi:class I SAM-dependent methyltransferase [Halomarina oriensis]|uniref:Methyltransferase domain-containing protein n=1 Tax=Halomarina oriensis TaxID=671145 RepID=A0A6B0GP21_9EURY|nr:class I SAM-dependent methyltransferase [Halomarina oriensis]MWG35721.1 methyltransferase domain-containing protein [Halomarina oriensis]